MILEPKCLLYNSYYIRIVHKWNETSEILPTLCVSCHFYFYLEDKKKKIWPDKNDKDVIQLLKFFSKICLSYVSLFC